MMTSAIDSRAQLYAMLWYGVVSLGVIGAVVMVAGVAWLKAHFAFGQRFLDLPSAWPPWVALMDRAAPAWPTRSFRPRCSLSRR